MNKLGIFALVFIALYGALEYEKSGMRQINNKLAIESLPENTELLESYFSGFGINHSYLWKIQGNGVSELDLLKRLKVVKLGPTSSSGCLSISEERAPGWWPSRDFIDVLWGNNESNYNLYVKELKHGAKVCVMDSLTDNTLYIQWFNI